MPLQQATEGVLHEAVTRARNEQRGTSQSQTKSEGTTRSDGSSWSQTATRGGGRTRKATLVPRLITREVVTSIQLFSTDEQVVVGARDIARQNVGEALVYTSGMPAMRVRFPLARRPFQRTPKFEHRQLMSLRDAIAAMPAFATPQQIMEERRVFERSLVAYLEQLSNREDRMALPPPKVSDNPQLSI